MDRALDHGINFFDTANVYGWKTGEGVTEQIIGRWFAQGGGRRDKVVLATKVYGKMGDWPNDQGLSARHIVARVRGVAAPAADRLDRPVPDAPRLPQHAVGGDLAGDGDCWSRRARCSTSARPTSPAGTWPRRRSRPTGAHFLGLVAEQCIYNLLTRHVELEVLPGRAASTASGIIPWSPLHGGLLSGALRKLREGAGGRAGERSRRRAGWSEHRDGDRGVREALRRAGRGPGQRRRWPGCWPGPA